MVFILFLSHRESLILREIYEQRQFKKKHQLIGILKSLHTCTIKTRSVYTRFIVSNTSWAAGTAVPSSGVFPPTGFHVEQDRFGLKSKVKIND